VPSTTPVSAAPTSVTPTSVTPTSVTPTLAEPTPAQPTATSQSPTSVNPTLPTFAPQTNAQVSGLKSNRPLEGGKGNNKSAQQSGNSKNSKQSAPVAATSKVKDGRSQGIFKGSNKFACLNADLTPCNEVKDAKGKASVDSQLAKSLESAGAAAVEMVSESFDEVPSPGNSGISNAGRSKNSVQMNQEMNDNAILNIFLLMF
jgi:hypothetical protein